MTSLIQKSLVGLTILATVVTVAILTGKKFSLEARRNERRLLEMIANVSNGLDRLDAGLEEVSTQTEVVKSRLKEFIAIHRENLAACATLRQMHDRKSRKDGKPKNRDTDRKLVAKRAMKEVKAEFDELNVICRGDVAVRVGGNEWTVKSKKRMDKRLCRDLWK